METASAKRMMVMETNRSDRRIFVVLCVNIVRTLKLEMSTLQTGYFGIPLFLLCDENSDCVHSGFVFASLLFVG
jgi:hypothetical protein